MSVSWATTYDDITCCHVGCGITFFVPQTWEQKRRKDHSTFYCPNGHSQSFRGETEEEKLRRELTREKHRAEQAQADARYHRDEAARIERRRAAMKGQVTKIKNRISKGVCPCCNRTFADLARHMQAKHPDWTPDAEPAETT